jgi:hypothetical protein
MTDNTSISGPIDPFSAEGAAHIAQLTGQQPAATPASVLKTPTMPTLPQPNASIPPAPPSIPSIDNILNTPDTPLDAKFNDLSTSEADTQGQLVGEGAYRTSQEQANDLAGKKATVTDLTARLNTLKEQASAIPLAVQNEFAGRGATAAGVTPFQTADLRNNTIQQLGVSAMLNAANGNVTTAQDQIDSAVKAKFDPLKAELAAQHAQLAALTPLLNKQEKEQAAIQTAQLAERSRLLAQQEADQKSIYDVMLKASEYGADSATLRSIQNATSLEAAINAAGKFTSDPIARQQAQLNIQKTQADIRLTNANIGKAVAEAQKARTGSVGTGGLSPEALDQQAQNYLLTGKLSTLGNGGAAAKLAILNRAAELASGPGGVPAAAAKYAAAANAVKTRTDSLTKLLASSSNLESQFARMTQLADQVNSGVTSGIAGSLAGSTGRALAAKLKNQFGDDTAARYTELINTIRSDYASMQAAVAGSKGAEYFSRAADQAIPTGLTGSQYKAIYGTLKTSSDNASSAIQGEINKVLDSATVAAATSGGSTPKPGSTIEQNGMTFRVNADGTATRIK